MAVGDQMDQNIARSCTWAARGRAAGPGGLAGRHRARVVARDERTGEIAESADRRDEAQA